MDADRDTRLARILDYPWEVHRYESWVQERVRESANRREDYLYADRVARFQPRDEDVLVMPADVQVVTSGPEPLLRSAAGVTVTLVGVSAPGAIQIAGALTGSRCLAEIEDLPGVSERDLSRFLRSAFGVMVFAPVAVQALEVQVSAAEITRFPGSPYEIVREYWENMAAVRRRLADRWDQVSDGGACLRLLRELHVLSLMGEELDCYYLPASPIRAKGVNPGALLAGRARTVETPNGTLFLSGPRANVSHIGGDIYHRVIYECAGDPAASQPHREFPDEQGVDWGRTILARARGDEQARSWFCPPRPLNRAHLGVLAGGLAAAARAQRAGIPEQVLSELAQFHYAFVHLHPFRCANQCLAMSVINHVLRLALGVGIPHLILDHLALRLTRPAYERVFREAARQFVVTTPDAVARYRELNARKHRSYAMIERINRCVGVPEALRLVQAEPEEARLALVPI